MNSTVQITFSNVVMVRTYVARRNRIASRCSFLFIYFNFFTIIFTYIEKTKGNKTYKSIVKVEGLLLTPGQEEVV